MNLQIQMSIMHTNGLAVVARKQAKGNTFSILSLTYLFDEGLVHLRSSAAQHHNNQPWQSETLTLGHSIRCRPATTEKGSRIRSEIYLVNRPIGVIDLSGLSKLYAHLHWGAGVLRGVRGWVSG